MTALANRILRYIRIVILAAILMTGINTCYGPPKFWSNYEGWKESDVVARLGTPLFDSRVIGNDKPGQPYSLGWYHGFGMQLGMKFDANGKVVSQWSGSK